MCHYFRVSNKLVLQRVMSRFFVEFFLSHSAEKFRRGILESFNNLGYRKILWITGGGDEEEGSIKIFRRKFVLQCRKIS